MAHVQSCPDLHRWALVHIITRLELGGAQRVCMRQVSASALGTGARYLAFGPGGLLDGEAHALAGVQALPVKGLVRAIHPGRDLRAFAGLVAQLRRVRARHSARRLLVHTHSSKAGILGRLAARAAGADCVVHTVHGFGHQPHMAGATLGALRWAERQAARCTDGYVWVAEANLQRARAEGLLPPGARHALVRAGVDVRAFAAAPRGPCLNAELGLAAHAPVVLGVACMKPQKDLFTWLQVAARVVQQLPQAVFVLAGDGALRGPLQAWVDARNLGGSIKLLGWRHDVAAWMHRAQLLLHTSLWEGLPQVFVQAMAAGLPVVATHVDGAAEAVVDGVTGLLRPAKDVAGLSRAALALLRAPQVAQAFGDNGRARAQAFDERPSLAALDAFYGQLTARFCCG